MKRLRRAFIGALLSCLVAGPAFAGPIVLTTSSLQADAIGCFITAVKNATVTAQLVHESGTQTLYTSVAFNAGEFVGFIPSAPSFPYGYCRFIIEKGGKAGVVASACAYDGTRCTAMTDAR